MRLNQFIAQATGLSRRKADVEIHDGKVTVNGTLASVGQQVETDDTVILEGKKLQLTNHRTIILHKPPGYVTSRSGQGSKTIYELLPPNLRQLKPIGRLDKDSSGLIILTNDGNLANQLTHPRYKKEKVYEVTVDKPVTSADQESIRSGVTLDDGPSALELRDLGGNKYEVKMSEGRNRQIRRTFAALDYKVIELHRTKFGHYDLSNLPAGKWRLV